MNTVLRSRATGAEQTGASNDRSRRRLSDIRWPFVVGLAAVVLCAPFIRYVWFLGDEGVLLRAAERLLRGNRIYVDFFEFLPPGAFIVTEAWFSITGVSLFSARVLAILTIAAIACFTYLACRQASKHALLSALIAIGWVIISQGEWTQLSHHWFTTVFSMIAAWATLTSIECPQPQIRWQLAAGIAAGAAAMVTPTRGTLAVLAAATPFLYLRLFWRELAATLLGAAIVPTCIIVYLTINGEIFASFNDVIVFAATRYASIQPIRFGLWGNDELKLLFPLASLLALVTLARGGRECLRDPMLRTCAAFGFAGFIGCFPRPDEPHLAFTAPLVCPLLAYGIRRLCWDWRPKYRYAAAAVAIAFVLPAARSLLRLSYTVSHATVVSMPRGSVVLAERGVRELAARIAATPPRDGFLFYPYMPMVSFLTARRHVSRYDIFTPNYTLPSQYQEACVSAMRDATWVVIDRNWTDPKYLTTVFPAMRNPQPAETKKFEQALETGFDFVARDGAYELRRRVRGVDETICSGIAG